MGIAAGVPVLNRTLALESFLESVEGTDIESVIVADNGRTGERRDLYDRTYHFELTVIDLEFDAGIGACRSAIAEEFSSDYLLVADCDMLVPGNISVLVDVLETEPELGGVSGILQEDGRFRSGARNLFERPLVGGGTSLMIGIESTPDIERIAGHYVARFDFLTNAAVLRRECIEDYSWTSELHDREHLDFYVGHLHETEWEFAVSPEVHFAHRKGHYENYREQYRDDQQRRESANRLFLDRWGYQKVWGMSRTEWIDTESTGFPDLRSVLRSKIPAKYQILVHDLLSGLRR